MSSASAGSTKSSTFSATISPTTVAPNTATQFTITVANASTSSNAIGSIQIVVPSTSSVSVPSLLADGWTGTTAATCNSGSPTNCGKTGTTLVQFNSPSGGTNKIAAGTSLQFPVIAALSGSCTTSWAMAANSSAAWSSGSTFTPPSSFPTVAVAAATAASLSYVVAPPSELTAGTTFTTSVRLLDANNCPIPGAAVSLSAAPSSTAISIFGTTSATTVATGTATFTGLYVTTAWTSLSTTATEFSVTASAAGLNSSASMQVDPTAAASLNVVGPSAPVQAGTSFNVSATLADAYGNPVVPGTQVSISVDGGAATTQGTGLSGSPLASGTTFTVLAPTAVGQHSLTVTSGTLSFTGTFTVIAGPADHMLITSVADPVNGGLSKNSPFNVTVTAYDQYGNLASAYGQTVTLSTSGGVPLNTVGSIGGTTSGTFGADSSLTISGVTYSGYANNITLTATDSTLPHPTATTTIEVDLYAQVFKAPSGSSSNLNLGGCTVSPSTPVCTSLLLPKGANGSGNNVFLGEGACVPSPTDSLTCLTGSTNQTLLINAVANLSGLTSRTNPATLILTCDKTLCGGSGATTFNLLFQPTGSTSYLLAPACPSKGHIGQDQQFCQDFTQDHRTGAGNLVAYLLFLDDSKITFG